MRGRIPTLGTRGRRAVAATPQACCVCDEPIARGDPIFEGGCGFAWCEEHGEFCPGLSESERAGLIDYYSNVIRQLKGDPR